MYVKFQVFIKGPWVQGLWILVGGLVGGRPNRGILLLRQLNFARDKALSASQRETPSMSIQVFAIALEFRNLTGFLEV